MKCRSGCPLYVGYHESICGQSGACSYTKKAVGEKGEKAHAWKVDHGIMGEKCPFLIISKLRRRVRKLKEEISWYTVV